MANKTCNNCIYCAESGEDMVCVNPESEYVADFVEKKHTCDDWNGNAYE